MGAAALASDTSLGTFGKCRKQYNRTDHRTVLLGCGHTVCESCVVNVECQICQTTFDSVMSL